MSLGVDPTEILVVVPTLNEAAHIEATLTALMDGAAALEKVRFVVADGGSEDGTREIVARIAAARPNLVLLDNPDRLQSAAVNRAVEAEGAGRAVLVRADAHAVYPPRFALDVAESLRAHGTAALATPMDAVGRGAFQRAVATITDTRIGAGGSAHRGGAKSQWVDHGHHAGFDLAWFRKVGGYDPDFSHNEDAEYDRRLTEAGGRIWLDATIRLGVFPRETPRGLMRQYWNYGRGRARTVLKHAMRPRLRQMIPVGHVLALAASAIAAAASGEAAALLYPAAYGALCAGASLWAAARIGTAGFWAGPALAIMHTAWGAGFLVQAARGRRGRRADIAGAGVTGEQT